MAKNDLYKKNWYLEFLNPNEIHAHRLGKIVKNVKTKYHDIKIIDTLDYGRCFFLDGKLQSAELDEFVFHEALVHPALFMHPKPQRIFIGGGGEGAVLREVLKHPSIKEVVMAETDKTVTDCAKEFLSKWHKGSFRDKRVKLFHQDAKKFFQKEKRKFDCIFLDIDSSEDVNKKFFDILKKRITEEGFVVVRSGSANINMLKGFYGVFKTLKNSFEFVDPYFVPVSSFAGPRAFFLASKRKINPFAGADKKIKGLLRFYNTEVRESMFVVPPHIKKNLK